MDFSQEFQSQQVPAGLRVPLPCSPVRSVSGVASPGKPHHQLLKPESWTGSVPSPVTCTCQRALASTLFHGSLGLSPQSPVGVSAHFCHIPTSPFYASSGWLKHVQIPQQATHFPSRSLAMLFPLLGSPSPSDSPVHSSGLNFSSDQSFSHV